MPISTFDSLERPDWDLWFISLCYVISQKSIDKDTKHGAIFTSSDKTILSVGYNGPPRECNDSSIPLTRPEKYRFLLHAEEAAIANAAKHGINLQNSTLYITGMPCEKCFRLLINVGVRKIIYGNISSACVDKDSLDAIKIMNSSNKIEMIQFKGNAQILLQHTIEYLQRKLS